MAREMKPGAGARVGLLSGTRTMGASALGGTRRMLSDASNGGCAVGSAICCGGSEAGEGFAGRLRDGSNPGRASGTGVTAAWKRARDGFAAFTGSKTGWFASTDGGWLRSAPTSGGAT